MIITDTPICILDDDASVLRSIHSLLESEGLPARTFEKAEGFFAHVRTHTVRLAVLDVCLTETSGIEVQARLRDCSPGTHVIMMTGREEPGIIASAMENGAHAFLLKPFEDEEFLSHVHAALARAD